MAIGLGAPPLMAALAFGFFSNLNAATTHYGTGPAPIVFGAGYVTQAEWWRIGFPDLAGASGDLAADRLPVVEGDPAFGERGTSMKTYRVAVIPGDGIGKEVTPAAILVLEAAAAQLPVRLRMGGISLGL